MQFNTNAVTSFHNMLDMCATSVLEDLDARVEASGDLGSSNQQAEEKRTARETFRVRWHFLIKQIFIDWSFWAKCSPVATLQHVRQLLMKAKSIHSNYRGHLSITTLLVAAGFYFA